MTRVPGVRAARSSSSSDSGFVDATLGGQPARLALDVVVSYGSITWALKPIADK